MLHKKYLPNSAHLKYDPDLLYINIGKLIDSKD